MRDSCPVHPQNSWVVAILSHGFGHVTVLACSDPHQHESRKDKCWCLPQVPDIWGCASSTVTWTIHDHETYDSWLKDDNSYASHVYNIYIFWQLSLYYIDSRSIFITGGSSILLTDCKACCNFVNLSCVLPGYSLAQDLSRFGFSLFRCWAMHFECGLSLALNKQYHLIIFFNRVQMGQGKELRRVVL